ncbi:urease accessory protein UreF [Isosphaeraceae bacterium EP7]
MSIPTDTRPDPVSVPMTDLLGVMRLLQFGDSMLPVGSFSFSNGLESAVQCGLVQDQETLEAFVRTAVRQAGTSDGIALLEAHRGTLAGDLSRVILADHAVFDRKLGEELRTMNTRMGRKLAEMAGRVNGDPAAASWLASIRAGETPGTYPVAQGLVFASMGLDERIAFGVHQYGVASMMLGAALRLMRLDYLDAQAILYRINDGADAAYERAAVAPLEEMASYAPSIDVLAAVHVGAHVRMFMN